MKSLMNSIRNYNLNASYHAETILFAFTWVALLTVVTILYYAA